MVTKASLLASNPDGYQHLQEERNEINNRSSWKAPIIAGLALSAIYSVLWLFGQKNICHLDPNYVKQTLTNPLLYGNLIVVVGGAALCRMKNVYDWNSFDNHDLDRHELDAALSEAMHRGYTVYVN